MADFLEKMKNEIHKGVATVSAKSREMLEISRVKAQVEALTRQKKDALEELGSIVFTFYSKGTSDEERVRNKCEALTSLTNQIREKEEELREIRMRADETAGKQAFVGVCICGSPIPEGTKFCGSCGRKVEVTLPGTCSGCGAPLAPDARFCAHCGCKTG